MGRANGFPLKGIRFLRPHRPPIRRCLLGGGNAAGGLRRGKNGGRRIEECHQAVSICSGQIGNAFSGTKKGLMIIHHKSFKILVRLERFELPAYRFVACCSIQLSYSRITRKRYSRTARFRQAFFGELSRKKSLLCGKKYFFHYNIMILSVFIFLKKDKKHSFRMRLPGDWAEGFNDSGRLKWERGGAYSFGKRPPPFLNVSKTPAEAGAFPRT
jgi:hypothetical protein